MPPQLAVLILVAAILSSGCGGRTGSVEAQTPATPAARPQADPTWKWSDQRVQEFWKQLSPGPTLKPAEWPNGAVVAVALSFDYQMGTVYDENVAASTNTNSMYDGRSGLPRLLRALDKHQVPASFFVTGITAQYFPDTIQQILASGRHEIGVHGWIHENNTSVPAEDEKRLLLKAIDALTKAAGKKPVGYRSPSWQFSASTLSLLREQGFLYDSGMMADEEPYEIVANGSPTGLLEIPVEWMRDDAMYYPRQNPSSPEAFEQVLRAEFDKAYEEHGLFQVTMHPRISGHRSRVAMLERLITYIRGHRNVWFATHEQVARHVRNAQAGRSH